MSEAFLIEGGFKAEITEGPFTPEITRPFFEEMFLKAMAHLGLSQEEVREDYLTRSVFDNEQYMHLETQSEWQGWKNGVMMGYELWGKKG